MDFSLDTPPRPTSIMEYPTDFTSDLVEMMMKYNSYEKKKLCDLLVGQTLIRAQLNGNLHARLNAMIGGDCAAHLNTRPYSNGSQTKEPTVAVTPPKRKISLDPLQIPTSTIEHSADLPSVPVEMTTRENFSKEKQSYGLLGNRNILQDQKKKNLA